MVPPRRTLPSGTVTFAFTDIEGSTRLLHDLGQERYAEAQAEHRRLLRTAFGRHGGVEVDTQGDAFFYAFPTAAQAVEGAREGRDALRPGPIRVRMGIHTGAPHLTDEGYVGEDVNKGARIASAGHGGQVLLSIQTRELLDVDVMDLGEHRLKDFDEPVWIFQLGSERHPPLKTISNTNLPRPASSFIGREREVEHLGSLLKEGARLLTLTGPGGAGKTRLAIEAASALVPEYRNGVFWVELAPLREPAVVIETIGKVLGAKDGLAAYIGERELLLLLDNFEQVVDAAPELSSLLALCPNLRLIVTSRELLRVQGEVEYAVPPLDEPEAVELFCTRSLLEADETIALLCHRLDDLPLAVELAAARTSVLSPAQILQRLSSRLDLLKGGRDADPRQATLRATIEWSYDLLSSEEKILFARLAVFVGGCTLPSAEEVATADLDTLQSLVDKSLIRHTEDRFWMLETIREYAIERLEGSGEIDEMRRRHAEHFLMFAEEAEPHVREEVLRLPGKWLEQMEREHDNLRVAIDRLEALGETEMALRLVGSASWFWYQASHIVEGRRRLENALRADERPTAARARALSGAAGMTVVAGDVEAGRIFAEEALALHRTLGDKWGIADALANLGYAVAEGGDMIKARGYFEESILLSRDIEDVDAVLWVSRSLGWTYHALGDLRRAREMHEENLGRARALHNESVEATTMAVLAMIAVRESRIADAVPLLRDAYTMHRDIGQHLEAVTNLSHFAATLAAAGKAATAARVLACSQALFEEMGANVPWVARMNEESLVIIRSQLDEVAIAQAQEQGRTLSADQAAALALADLE